MTALTRLAGVLLQHILADSHSCEVLKVKSHQQLIAKSISKIIRQHHGSGLSGLWTKMHHVMT